jgi:hypothetical protein
MYLLNSPSCPLAASAAYVLAPYAVTQSICKIGGPYSHSYN